MNQLALSGVFTVQIDILSRKANSSKKGAILAVVPFSSASAAQLKGSLNADFAPSHK